MPDLSLGPPAEGRFFGSGLFHGLLRLVRLDDNSAKGVRRRVAVISLLAWLPLLMLVTAQGHLLQGVAVPFVRDIVRRASATAALKCTRLGSRAGLPSVDELAAFLLSHPTQRAP